MTKSKMILAAMAAVIALGSISPSMAAAVGRGGGGGGTPGGGNPSNGSGGGGDGPLDVLLRDRRQVAVRTNCDEWRKQILIARQTGHRLTAEMVYNDRLCKQVDGIN